MSGSIKFVFSLCLFGGMQASALAQTRQVEPRGKVLYATHCNACHSLKIHWREQKLATDWASLYAQVRRWQASIGQSWSEEEITEVAEYLNSAHYGFPVTNPKGLSQGEKPNPALRHY